MHDIVYINVGGVYFVSRRSTLLQHDSFFNGFLRAQPDCSEYFVDRDPTHFRHILNWIRGIQYLPEDDGVLEELAWEADYYCMHDMHHAIAQRRERSSFSMHRALHGIHQEIRRF